MVIDIAECEHEEEDADTSMRVVIWGPGNWLEGSSEMLMAARVWTGMRYQHSEFIAVSNEIRTRGITITVIAHTGESENSSPTR